ncbi:hypothetical protein GO003_017905 [Methylicorpusculum oleiharenae]|uniref:hypothetical protein n=1 Tax=Methylicorpusculum oleiharenae TaxID=1338687 RepID=UPI00135BB1C4|nr:hypothetical protein [Methylicorpusculum oleiharenae]MCD2452267.1 hypothetical protein [Methylicorpusculum oleiharenae]
MDSWNVSTHFFLMMMLLLLSVLYAMPTAKADENAGNAGQDFTRPLGRVDVRWTYRDLSDGVESHTTTLRAEQPWDLSDQWKLNTRFDIPGIYKTLPNDNQGKWGLGNVDVQMGLIHTFNSRFAMGSGVRGIFPTASDDRFGTGKYQLLIGGGGRVMLPEISSGSFIAPQLQYNFDIGGDPSSSAISVLRIQPTLHVGLPKVQFLTFLSNADIRYNFNNKKWFLPIDVTYGKRWGDLISSIEVSYPIIDDLDLYEVKTQLRVGYFF